MDACLWLLSRGVDAERLCWIVPHDPWLLDRAQYQPGSREFAAAMASQMEAAAEATSLEDMFAKLEQRDLGLAARSARRADGLSMRDGEPGRARAASSHQERGPPWPRQANDVGRIELQDGMIETDPEALHIDCSAKGIAPKPLRPIWADDRITVQYVRACGQPSFSAAMIAAIEAKYGDAARKNALARRCPERTGTSTGQQ